MNQEKNRLGRRTIFVIAGPTNSGKTTVMGRLLAMPELDLAYVVTTNSREPRPDEADGRDYHFVSREKFEEMIAAGLFVEWAVVHNDYKGVQKRSLDIDIPPGKRIILQLDIQGFHAFKRLLPEAEYKIIGIFLVPPSMDELVRRMKLRGELSPEDTAKRMESAKKEMAGRASFDYVIMNDNLEKCIAEVAAAVRGN